MRAMSLGVLIATCLAALVTPAAQVRTVERILTPLPFGTATIAGQVLTPSGAPAAGARITLRAPEADPDDYFGAMYGPRELVADRSGRFEFDKVPGQTLELHVSADGFLAAVYGQALPGLPGTPIRLRPTQRLSVTLTLAEGSSISGLVLDPSGVPAAGVGVHAFRLEPLADAAWIMGVGGNAETNERGEYRIANLPPGLYVLSGYRQSGTAAFRRGTRSVQEDKIPLAPDEHLRGIDLQFLTAPVPVAAENATPASRTGATVTGRVTFARPLPPSEIPKRFTLFLARVTDGQRLDVPGVAPTAATPEFTYEGVPPGQYVITVNREALPKGWRMRSVMVAGRDALDFPFDVRDQARVDVTITLTDRVTELAGRVLDRTGAPQSDSTIVIFADDERYWTIGSRRIRTVRPDTNGGYEIRGLAPGTYVVGLGPPTIYGRPPTSLLRSLSKSGARVTLVEGRRVVLNLRRP